MLSFAGNLALATLDVARPTGAFEVSRERERTSHAFEKALLEYRWRRRRRRVTSRASAEAARPQEDGHRHHGVALPVARLAHGRAFPGRLPPRGHVARAAAGRRVLVRRSIPGQRSEQATRQGVRL